MAYGTKTEENFYREDAMKALDKVKQRRKGRKFKPVQTGNKTWKEVEVK